jgi:hypothetical protein
MGSITVLCGGFTSSKCGEGIGWGTPDHQSAMGSGLGLAVPAIATRTWGPHIFIWVIYWAPHLMTQTLQHHHLLHVDSNPFILSTICTIWVWSEVSQESGNKLLN